VEPQEARGQRGVGEHRIREPDVAQRVGFGIVRERGEVGDLNDHQARLPRALVDGAARVGMGGISGDQLAWPDQAALAAAARAHRLLAHDSEDILAAGLQAY
jgi:hypothetical protein